MMLPVTNNQLSMIEAAMAWQSDAILARYVAHEGASESQANRCFEAFKQFLIVCAIDHESARSPSAAIDEMWHTALMFTREYREYCMRHFGHFVDHEPFVGTPDLSVYGSTRDVAERLFGPLDAVYWPQAQVGDCGGTGGACAPSWIADCGGGCGRGISAVAA